MYRDEQFADDVDDDSDSASSRSGGGGSDRRHFDEILAGYRLILTGKRVDPVDIRVKTGWWAESTGAATSSCGSAGKVGPSVSFWTGQSSPVLLHNSRLPSIPIPIPFHYCPDNPPFSSTPFPHLFPILAPPVFLSNNPTLEIEMRCGAQRVSAKPGRQIAFVLENAKKSDFTDCLTCLTDANWPILYYICNLQFSNALEKGDFWQCLGGAVIPLLLPLKSAYEVVDGQQQQRLLKVTNSHVYCKSGRPNIS